MMNPRRGKKGMLDLNFSASTKSMMEENIGLLLDMLAVGLLIRRIRISSR